MTNSKENEHEMHRQVDWLRPSDRQILLEVSKYGGWIKAASLHLNLPYSHHHVSNRCRILANHGLLDRHGDSTAAYKLSDKGRAFLNDELEAQDLREGEE